MFQLKPDRKETENKTIRFPVELINSIEKVLVGKNATFSAFVIQACEYALANMGKMLLFRHLLFKHVSMH